jgi:GlpG protein
MRLIGDFKDERQVFGFHTFLLKQGIQNTYDPFKDSETKEISYHLWITEEEDFDKACALYEEFCKNPEETRFRFTKEEVVLPTNTSAQNPKWKVRVEIPKTPPRISLTLTNFVIMVCALIYFWNNAQMYKVEQTKGAATVELIGSPLQQKLLFDYPQYLDNFALFLDEYSVKNLQDIKNLSPEGAACFKKLQETPTWKGATELLVTRSMKDWDQIPPGTLFGKIRQGEIWRLFTPVLLHQGILHILFNMAWVWILGRQMEQRLGKFRLLLMMVITGIVANVAQYLMGGPAFVGYSGIVVGMVGFIWVRQKIAPWEGYPLQRPTILFILIFVLAMLGLELISLGLDYFHVTEMYANIANTAHIVGGLVGMLLARIPFFARGRP